MPVEIVSALLANFFIKSFNFSFSFKTSVVYSSIQQFSIFLYASKYHSFLSPLNVSS